nr:hypothetical protein [Streptomyces sp. P3]
MNKTGPVGPLGSSQRTAPVGGSTSTVSDSEPYRVLGSARGSCWSGRSLTRQKHGDVCTPSLPFQGFGWVCRWWA